MVSSDPRGQDRSDLSRAREPRLCLRNAFYSIPRSRRGESRSIIRGACLEISPGERVGVIGPNGAGKSTLLKVLAGHLKLSQGLLINDGFAPQDQRRRYQRSVHLMSGAPLGFYPRLTGAENLRFLAGLWGVNLSEAKAVGALVDVGIERSLATAMYAKYSMGMRQRVHLAAARLDPYATTYLLDEPTTGLDANGIRVLRNFVTGASQAAFVLVSHDESFLQDVCSRVVRLESGRLVG